jgi:hypothetical protein
MNHANEDHTASSGAAALHLHHVPVATCKENATNKYTQTAANSRIHAIGIV